jgi:hypothetical protein
MAIVQDLTSILGFTPGAIGYAEGYYLFGSQAGPPYYRPILYKWDGVTLTNLTSGLIGFNVGSFNGVNHIEHNGSYWLIGDRTSGYLNKYSGGVFTDLTAGLGITDVPDYLARHIQGIVWTGTEWHIYTQRGTYSKSYNGSTFSDLPSPAVWFDDLVNFSSKSGVVMQGGARGTLISYDGSVFAQLRNNVLSMVPNNYITGAEDAANPYGTLWPYAHEDSAYRLILSYKTLSADGYYDTYGVLIKYTESGGVYEDLSKFVPHFTEPNAKIFGALYFQGGGRKKALFVGDKWVFCNGSNYLYSTDGGHRFGVEKFSSIPSVMGGYKSSDSTFVVAIGASTYIMTAPVISDNISFHSSSTDNRFKTVTYSTFTFPDPAGTGFTAGTGYSMLAGWGLLGAISMILSGTLRAAGSLGRKIKTSLAGTLTPTGALTAVKRILQTLYGTLNLTGAFSGVRQVLLSGTLNLSGALNRLIKKTFAGTLNLTGSLVGGTLKFFQSLAGELSMSGALATLYRFSKALAGTLNLSGYLIKKAKKNLSGVLTSSGSLGRKIYHALSGVLNLAGALGKGLPLFRQALAGTLAMSGGLNRKIKKSLSGTLNLLGGLLNAITSIRIHHYTIEVHDSAGLLLAILKDAYKISLTETINAPKILTFFSPADEAKLSNITRAAELWVRDMRKNTIIAKTRLERRDDDRK